MRLLLISLGLIFCTSLLFYFSSHLRLLYFRSISVSNGLEDIFHFKNDMHVCFYASAPNILSRDQPSFFSLYNLQSNMWHNYNTNIPLYRSPSVGKSLSLEAE